MPNILQVTLDKTTTPWTVDINESGNANHVSQSPNAQTITWQLSGNAATGSFGAVNDPTHPAFAWIGTAPPSGIFGTPTLSANGNTLTMTDLNNSTSTQGTWIYKLWIQVGGTYYSSLATSIRANNTDPTIKNN